MVIFPYIHVHCRDQTNISLSVILNIHPFQIYSYPMLRPNSLAFTKEKAPIYMSYCVWLISLKLCPPFQPTYPYVFDKHNKGYQLCVSWKKQYYNSVP